MMRVTVSAVAALFMLVVTSCVTINVYFPAAEAERAADRFIDGVIGPTNGDGADAQSQSMQPLPSGVETNQFSGPAWHWSQLFISAAYAQVNIDISTPEIKTIQLRMQQRFESELASAFDSGAIGFTNRALIQIRDLSAVSLKSRNKLKAAVAADNRDRDAVYREIAVANGHPEWESRIRQTFAERWIAKARSGWYYQNAGGNWQVK